MIIFTLEATRTQKVLTSGLQIQYLCLRVFAISSAVVAAFYFSLFSALLYFSRTDSTDSPDCLPILLTISRFFYLLGFLFSTFQLLILCGKLSRRSAC